MKKINKSISYSIFNHNKYNMEASEDYYKILFFALVYTEQLCNNDETIEITDLLNKETLKEHDTKTQTIKCSKDGVDLLIKYYYRKDASVPCSFKTDFIPYYNSFGPTKIYCFAVIDKNQFIQFYGITRYQDDMYKSCCQLSNFIKDCDYYDDNPYIYAN